MLTILILLTLVVVSGLLIKNVSKMGSREQKIKGLISGLKHISYSALFFMLCFPIILSIAVIVIVSLRLIGVEHYAELVTTYITLIIFNSFYFVLILGLMIGMVVGALFLKLSQSVKRIRAVAFIGFVIGLLFFGSITGIFMLNSLNEQLAAELQMAQLLLLIFVLSMLASIITALSALFYWKLVDRLSAHHQLINFNQKED